MITREALADLLGFNSEPYLTTTLYLRIDNSAAPNFVIEAKDLIKQRKKELESQTLQADHVESVQSDLTKILDFVTLGFSREGVRTLVISSCSAKKWWKEMNLTIPLRSRLVVNSRPYFRPMLMALENHHRYLILLIERSRARFYELFAGRMQNRGELLEEVPNKVRAGGYGGYEERRIERHIQDHVKHHMKRVADRAFELFRATGCEYLILAGNEVNTEEFRNFLPTVLQERQIAAVSEEGRSSESDLLRKALQMEEQFMKKEQRALQERFYDQVDSGGLGIVGLDSIVRGIQLGQVNMLLVQEGFTASGYRCPECMGLQIEGPQCGYCGAVAHRVSDLVEELMEEALQQGCQVKSMTLPDSRLKTAGIGAMLRFKV
jgi:peptide chain release factor subunit 1